MHTRLGLLGHHDYRQLFVAASVSQLGAYLAQFALSLMAIDHLNASLFEAGVVVTLQFAGYFAVGLPAGAWVDRLRRRNVLIVADVGRALLLVSVPIGWWLGFLTIGQLYAVSLGYGVLTVFFDAAYQAYLPHIVGHRHLVEGNAKLEAVRASAQVSAPALGGLLVRAMSVPLVLLVDALAMAASVVFYVRIRKPEPTGKRHVDSRVVREIRDGLGFVLRNTILRPLVLCTGIFNFFFALYSAVLVYFLRKEVGVGPDAVGIVLSAIGLGAVIGAATATRAARRLGVGRAIWMSAAFSAPFMLAMPVAELGWRLWVATAACAVAAAGGAIYKVNQVSLRQAITPYSMMGRMNATVRFLAWGLMPVGGLLGSVLGEVFGARTAVLVGVLGMSTAFVPVVCSEVRAVRDVLLAQSEPTLAR